MQENWRELDLEPGIGAAVATPHGTISLRLHHRVRVDMTIDHAIRIINLKVILYLQYIKIQPLLNFKLIEQLFSE